MLSALNARRVIAALVVVVLLLVGAAGVAAYVAHTNKERADRWRDRAERLQRNADALNALLVRRTGLLNLRARQLNALAAKVQLSTEALARSEGDVQSLEERQRALANEKAQLEDARAALEQEQRVLADVASRYVRCSNGLKHAFDAVVNQDTAWLDANGADVESTCSSADAALQDFQSAYGG